MCSLYALGVICLIWRLLCRYVFWTSYNECSNFWYICDFGILLSFFVELFKLLFLKRLLSLSTKFLHNSAICAINDNTHTPWSVVHIYTAKARYLRTVAVGFCDLYSGNSGPDREYFNKFAVNVCLITNSVSCYDLLFWIDIALSYSTFVFVLCTHLCSHLKKMSNISWKKDDILRKIY